LEASVKRSSKYSLAFAAAGSDGAGPQSLLEQVARAGPERGCEPPERVELGVGPFVLDLGDEPLVQAGIGRERYSSLPMA
jgi:hypothetical protein